MPGNDQYILSIDIGTQSAKVAIFDDKLNMIGKSERGYQLISPRPGWAEEDPEIWWKATIENIREVLEKTKISPSNIIGIGISGQMHATVPISRDGELLSHGVPLWCDKRSSQQVEDIKKKIDEKELMKITGNIPSPAWWGFHIAWFKENMPHVYDKTFKFLTAGGFIAYKLTGTVSIDWTEASGSFLMNTKTLEWSMEILELLRIDIDKLPPIYKSYDVIGTVTEEAARLTGLKPGTPVVAGAGDFLSAALGIGISKGRGFIMTGTASDVAAYTDEPLYTPLLQNLHHAIPGWITFGIIEGPGLLLRWFRDVIATAEVEKARYMGVSPYQVIDEEANSVKPGSNGLIVYPYPLGERPPGNINSRAVIFGLLLTHDRAHIARAILEGVAYAEREIIELIESFGVKIESIRIANGGARSIVWSKIRADVFGKPVFIPLVSEGTLLGDAILAGIGTGLYKIHNIYSVIDDVVKPREIIEPNEKNHLVYNKYYNIYKKFRKTFWSLFDELANIELKD